MNSRDRAAYMRAYRARLRALGKPDESAASKLRKRVVFKLTRHGIPRDEARRIARDDHAH